MSAIPGLSDLQLALQNAKQIDNFIAAYEMDMHGIVANRQGKNRRLMVLAVGCLVKN